MCVTFLCKNLWENCLDVVHLRTKDLCGEVQFYHVVLIFMSGERVIRKKILSGSADKSLSVGDVPATEDHRDADEDVVGGSPSNLVRRSSGGDVLSVSPKAASRRFSMAVRFQEGTPPALSPGRESEASTTTQKSELAETWPRAGGAGLQRLLKKSSQQWKKQIRCKNKEPFPSILDHLPTQAVFSTEDRLHLAELFDPHPPRGPPLVEVVPSGDAGPPLVEHEAQETEQSAGVGETEQRPRWSSPPLAWVPSLHQDGLRHKVGEIRSRRGFLLGSDDDLHLRACFEFLETEHVGPLFQQLIKNYQGVGDVLPPSGRGPGVELQGHQQDDIPSSGGAIMHQLSPRRITLDSGQSSARQLMSPVRGRPVSFFDFDVDGSPKTDPSHSARTHSPLPPERAGRSPDHDGRPRWFSSSPAPRPRFLAGRGHDPALGSSRSPHDEREDFLSSSPSIDTTSPSPPRGSPRSPTSADERRMDMEPRELAHFKRLALIREIGLLQTQLLEELETAVPPHVFNDFLNSVGPGCCADYHDSVRGDVLLPPTSTTMGRGETSPIIRVHRSPSSGDEVTPEDHRVVEQDRISSDKNSPVGHTTARSSRKTGYYTHWEDMLRDTPGARRPRRADTNSSSPAGGGRRAGDDHSSPNEGKIVEGKKRKLIKRIRYRRKLDIVDVGWAPVPERPSVALAKLLADKKGPLKNFQTGAPGGRATWWNADASFDQREGRPPTVCGTAFRLSRVVRKSKKLLKATAAGAVGGVGGGG